MSQSLWSTKVFTLFLYITYPVNIMIISQCCFSDFVLYIRPLTVVLSEVLETRMADQRPNTTNQQSLADMEIVIVTQTIF